MFTVENKNYGATVVVVESLNELVGCDNVVGMPMFGMQAIVGKTTKVGDMGILFPTECQLSEDFCRNNNLYRDASLNADELEKGYMETNRRVKAIKFRGHPSSAFFMPISSLSYIDFNHSLLLKGFIFDSINGIQVCKKYEVGRGEPGKNKVKGKEKKQLVDPKLFPEHLDSDNYWRNSHMLNRKDVYITQKLHGTSGRFGNIRVEKELSLWQKVLSFLGADINVHEYRFIAGSRRVVKDNSGGDGYYDIDVWGEVLERVKHKIPKNFIIYGEIVGRIGEKPIQDGYTYGLEKGQNELYVYRVALVNEDGLSVDLSRIALVEFCTNVGFKYCPLLSVYKVPPFPLMELESFIDVIMDKSFLKAGYENAIALSEDSPCDEGVMIRTEGMTPYLLKAKCETFKQHESRVLDKGIEGIESSQS